MYWFLKYSCMSEKFSFLCSCFLNIQICLSPSTISGDKFPLSVPSSLHKTSAQCKVPAFSSVGLAMLAGNACLHGLLAMLCRGCMSHPQKSFSRIQFPMFWFFINSYMSKKFGFLCTSFLNIHMRLRNSVS